MEHRITIENTRLKDNKGKVFQPTLQHQRQTVNKKKAAEAEK